MNEQHEISLAALSEKLIEVFHAEADPDNWPGGRKIPTEQTIKERGDRAWSVKTANGVGLLAARSLELRTRIKWLRQTEAGLMEPPPPTGNLTPIDPDAEIGRFERDAVAALQALGMRRDK